MKDVKLKVVDGRNPGALAERPRSRDRILSFEDTKQDLKNLKK